MWEEERERKMEGERERGREREDKGGGGPRYGREEGGRWKREREKRDGEGGELDRDNILSYRLPASCQA